MRVIISGGGSGGHIFPAIAVADTLKRLRPGIEILFVGAKGRMEMEKVPKAGYKIKGLWISGLQRRLTWRNVIFPVKVISSLVQSWRLIKEFKPDAVAGFGGFASGPVVRAAAAKGLPTLIQEQNYFPGITNRWLASKVDRICVAFEGMDRFFPAEKIILTGNPVRKNLGEISGLKEEGKKYYDLDSERRTLLLFGGSLGAKALNEWMRNVTSYLEGNEHVQVIWQCGSLYYDQYKNCDTALLDNVRIMAFIDRMDLAYAAADLVICRSGALTIAELSITGKPAVMIPSPNVAEDHQTKNARALEEKNAVIILSEKELNADKMKGILELIDQDSKLDEMGKAMKQLGRPDAVEDIANEILKMIE